MDFSISGLRLSCFLKNCGPLPEEIVVDNGVPLKNSIQPVRKQKAQAQVSNLNDLPRRALRTTMRISGQAFALRLKKPSRQTLPVSDRC